MKNIYIYIAKQILVAKYFLANIFLKCCLSESRRAGLGSESRPAGLGSESLPAGLDNESLLPAGLDSESRPAGFDSESLPPAGLASEPLPPAGLGAPPPANFLRKRSDLEDKLSRQNYRRNLLTLLRKEISR